VTGGVLIRPAAEKDLDGARKWYNRQRSGLGDEFLISIAEAFTRLEQDPQRYRMLYRDFRRILVERFPYMIFYQIKGNNVIVLRILHDARDGERERRHNKFVISPDSLQALLTCDSWSSHPDRQ
jgi:plasmid stabilization system protein ParE